MAPGRPTTSSPLSTIWFLTSSCRAAGRTSPGSPRPMCPVAIDLTGPHLLERTVPGPSAMLATNSLEKCSISRGAISSPASASASATTSRPGLRRPALPSTSFRTPSPPSPTRSTRTTRTRLALRLARYLRPLRLRRHLPALAKPRPRTPDCVPLPSTSKTRGQLEIIGGKHPFYPIPTGIYGPLLDHLASSQRTAMTGLLAT